MINNIDIAYDEYKNKPLFSWIDINVTELCNRQCKFCPRNDPYIYPNQNLFISLKLCKKISKELKKINYKGGVSICGHGEPLLHSNIIEIISIFKNFYTILSTNSDLLDENLIKKLFTKDLTILSINLYNNGDKIEYYKDIFIKNNIKSDKVIIRKRWNPNNTIITNRAGILKSKNNIIIENNPCFYLAYSMQIDWNGDILLCIQDFNKKIKFGNLYVDSLLKIWFDSDMKKYRKKLLKGDRDIYPCKNCDTDGKIKGGLHSKMWNEIYDN